MVSAVEPYGRNLGFLDRLSFLFAHEIHKTGRGLITKDSYLTASFSTEKANYVSILIFINSFCYF
jgi:hypothetical protein